VKQAGPPGRCTPMQVWLVTYRRGRTVFSPVAAPGSRDRRGIRSVEIGSF
jgi:hypothetical protein